MAKRKPKKSSFWSPPAVVGRVVWGRGGFKGAVRQVRREWIGPRTVASIRVDPDTGTLQAAGVRQRTDGSWEVKPPRPRRKITAKRRIAEMQQRAARESDRRAAWLAAQKRPMAERVNRRPDGTFNGSDKATNTDADRAENAYLQAVRAAEKAEQRANRLLGYGNEPI